MCDFSNNYSIIDNSLKCRKGIWFYVDGILCIICLILLIYFSFSSILIFYKPSFILEENDTLKKSNSIPDIIFFINKIIFSILIYSTKGNESWQWILLIILFLSTFLNYISFCYYKSYENRILMKLNKGLSLVLFWSICSLIIGKIFQNWNFNGTIHLFLFGTILIIFFLIYHKEKINKFYIIDFNKIDTSQGQLIFIKHLLYLIKSKEKSRESFIEFKTLVSLSEENCINKNCALKKYLKLAEKRLESDSILYLYYQNLFEMSLKKYPDDIILKCNYAIYLVFQMSKKKLAQIILSTMIKKPFHYQNNYIIYCCSKHIEEYSFSSKLHFEEQNKNIMHFTEYKKIFNNFNDNLSKASSLYYEFWSSLYKSHLQGTEDFIKLNNIGEKINSLIDAIDKNFKIMNRVKSDDTRVLNIYIEFLKNVLNDIKKYKELKKILNSLSNEDIIKDKEIDYRKFDLKSLNNSDEYTYIIISAEEENLGTILTLPLNACQILGYNKNELIGKNINILLPEIFHKQFQKYLIHHTNNVKTKYFDLLTNKKEYYPDFFEKFIHVKTKSKYLIPLYIKFYFVQTEDNEHIYVIDFEKEENFTINKTNQNFKLNHLNTINKTKEVQSYNYCCVLTDYFFNIQTFTPNSQELLGLNSNSLNSNIDITNFIKQFKEELEKMIYEDNSENEMSKYEKSNINLINYNKIYKNQFNCTIKTNFSPNYSSTEGKKINFKRIIAENKFSELQLISWKISDLIHMLMGIKNNNSNYSLSNRSLKDKEDYIQYDNNFNKKNIYYENNKERSFLLIIKKIIFYGKKIGYKFYFKREKIKCIENESELNLENKDNFLILKQKTSIRKNSVSFNAFQSNYINENKEDKIENEYNNEKKSNLFKISKSLDSKKDKNILNLIEDNTSRSFQNEENQDNSIERIGSFSLKKKLLKRKLSKFSNSNILNNNKSFNILQKKLFTDENYIPNCSFNFIIDLETKSYRPTNKINKLDKTLNILKKEAYDKIKQYQTTEKNEKDSKDLSSYYSSDEESESYEDDEIPLSIYLSSNIDSNKKKEDEINSLNNNKEKTEETNKKNSKDEIEGKYYKVYGLNKIKFMIYDFDREMIIDKGVKKDIKSEMENNIVNYKFKIPIGMDKEINDPYLKINSFLSKYSNYKDTKNEKSEIIGISDNTIGVNVTKKNFKQKVINKKIENVLNKNKKEKLITRFFFLTILLTTILLIISGYVLFFIIGNLNTIENNLLLLIYGINVRHLINTGIYYVREMATLSINASNSFYSNYPFIENRTNYMKNITKKLKQVYYDGHNNMKLMIGMNLELSKYNSFILNNKPFKTEIIYDNFKKRTITSSLSVSIVQIYSYFYHLIISEDFQNSNQELYNFVYNSVNNVGIGIENIIKIFLEEIIFRRNKTIIMSKIYCVLIFILYIGMYFLISINYDLIILRKQSYISVFFDFNLNFIKTSMYKCEKFIGKINPNELLIAKEKNDDNFENSSNFSELDEDILIKNDINNKINIPNKKKINSKENTMIFKLKYFLFLAFSYIYIFIILYSFIDVLNKIEIIGNYIYHMQKFHNNLLNIFNAYREFIFSNDSVMYNKPIFDYLNYIEKDIYKTFPDDVNYIAINCVKIKGLSEIFLQIQKSSLCLDSGGAISNVQKCDNYMEIITSLGFYNFIGFFVEEIRIKRNYILFFEEIDFYFYLWNLSKEKRTVELFNFQNVHPDLNFMFNYIILPYINEERNLTENLILESIISNYYTYYTSFIIYFSLILIFYILYWFPNIIDINFLIYKAKNILKIIPVEILAIQTNIKSLLDISDLND